MKENIEIRIDNMLLQNIADDDSEFIPILSESEEEAITQIDVPDSIPILPLRNTVLFPGVLIPITVGREKSIRLIREVYRKNKIIGTVAQRDSSIEEPAFEDLNRIGTVAQILKILELPDGVTSVIIQGKKRFEMTELLTDDPYFTARVNILNEIKPVKDIKEFDAIISSLKDLSLKIIQLSSNIPPEAAFAIRNIESSSFLINFISSNSDISTQEKQKLLELNDLKERAILLLEYLSREVQMLELKNDIQHKVKTDLDDQQRQYLLHQQLKKIQDELGTNPVDQEIEEMKEEAKTKKWTKPVQESFFRELEKLERMHNAAPEYSIQLNYLKVLLELPWNEYTDDNFDLRKAEQILEEDHFGLEKVKERILEHIAVLKLKGDLKSPILCLYGPPGVGKTSLGKSIARAINRKYARMSLGGLHDEAEIRGHRKTYIGAMPGRIIQTLRKTKSSNPVFILDEIDKVGNDFRGDPSSALLEVLDNEQNSTFYDNYIEMEYDLSKIMFIATANSLEGIKPALIDRMELIEVSGYILEEKIEIAKRHLISKQWEAHGIKSGKHVIPDEVIAYIIEHYTRESGVRTLDKRLAKIARAIARKIAFGDKVHKKLTITDITGILGPSEFTRDKYQGNEQAGVVTGLAWTPSGGEILFIETSLSKGKEGKLTLTGNLGEVMKESAILALEYIKAHAYELDIPDEVFSKWNVHIHIPEGAIPKDGPSAGVAMVTSVVSAFTQRKVRNSVAMTGEITLRGKILPVGGIKEKILAAKRACITDILISAENRKDIEQIKEIYLKGLKFHYFSEIKELFDYALLKEKVKNPVPIT
ncbi:MAG: endopeptidase La [Bacteroidia bacterium]|nr:endopeptidase La [Bacteroidia bacterium]